MRIGILTYFWADNPGQFFQAYCTWKAVKQVYPSATVEFIDVRHWKWKWRPGKQEIFHPQFFIKRWFRHRNYDLEYGKFPRSSRSLITHDYREAGSFVDALNYDLIIVGSDVVLTMLSSDRVLNDDPPIYWVPEFVRAQTIALASSSDITRWEELSLRRQKSLKVSANKFSFIGVRDNMTYSLFSHMGVVDSNVLQVIPDPTFTLEISNKNIEHAERLCRKSGIKLNRPILGINLPVRSFTVKLLDKFRDKGYQIVSIGNYFPGAIWLGDLPPWIWTGVFAHFDLMLTVSFHETIFSLKHGVPVVAIDVNQFRIDIDRERSKTKSLLMQFALDELHHINPHKEKSVENMHQQIVKALNNHSPSYSIELSRGLGVKYISALRSIRNNAYPGSS